MEIVLSGRQLGEHFVRKRMSLGLLEMLWLVIFLTNFEGGVEVLAI